MDAVRSGLACPGCQATEVPKLIVRGTGKGNHGTSLQCRRCGHEWTEEQTWRGQAS